MPMNDPRLAFDKAAHTYAWEGRPLFGVSEILKEAGMTGSDWFTPESCQRGSYVHSGIALFHAGELDEAAIEPAYRPFFEAYFRFVERCKPDVLHQECRLADPDLGYGGTGDLVCGVELVGTEFPSPALCPYVEIDIKTGAVPSSVGPQTAAYGRIIAQAMGLPYIHRAYLHLQPSGQYALGWLDDFDDERVFLEALDILNWRRRHGRYEPHARLAA